MVYIPRLVLLSRTLTNIAFGAVVARIAGTRVLVDTVLTGSVRARTRRAFVYVYLAVSALVAGVTAATVRRYPVRTGGAVLARGIGAVVDVCNGGVI